MSAEPDPLEEPKKKGPNRVGRWIASQVNNLDLPRREAAAEICARWDVTWSEFRMGRVIRTLRREDSPHLLGALLLAEDYTTTFGETALADVGPVGMVNFDIVTCAKCRREAIPGSEMCGRHGGQYLAPEDARRISEHTAAKVLNATDKALRVLEELLDTGKSELVRLQAANSILDRAGITSAQRIELEVSSGASVAELLASRLEQVRGSMEKVEQISMAKAEEDAKVEVEAEVED